MKDRGFFKIRLLMESIAIIFFLLFLFLCENSSAQRDTSKLFRPNVIKLNVTSNILYSPTALFSYERAVGHHQSFSVEAGYLQFPQLFKNKDSAIILRQDIKRGGFKIGGDYRFYLPKENKHNAPHGLYVGPFISYYNFWGDKALGILDTSVVHSDLVLHTKISFLNAGAMLGYQFSFLKDRLTVDLVLIGPALTYYHVQLKLDGDITKDEDAVYLQKLYDYLIANVPGFNHLVSGNSINSDGRADIFSVGFRYSVSVGFRF